MAEDQPTMESIAETIDGLQGRLDRMAQAEAYYRDPEAWQEANPGAEFGEISIGIKDADGNVRFVAYEELRGTPELDAYLQDVQTQLNEAMTARAILEAEAAQEAEIAAQEAAQEAAQQEWEQGQELREILDWFFGSEQPLDDFILHGPKGMDTEFDPALVGNAMGMVRTATQEVMVTDLDLMEMARDYAHQADTQLREVAAQHFTEMVERDLGAQLNGDGLSVAEFQQWVDQNPRIDGAVFEPHLADMVAEHVEAQLPEKQSLLERIVGHDLPSFGEILSHIDVGQGALGGMSTANGVGAGHGQGQGGGRDDFF